MSRDRGPYVQLLRSLPDSEKVNAVSEGAECLYVRLLASADDAGRFPGDPKWILAKLFTARMIAGQVTSEIIDERLVELDQAGLVHRYVVDGKPFVEIVNHFRQNRADVKTKVIYPGPGQARNEPSPVTDRTRNGFGTDASRERIERVSPEQNRTEQDTGPSVSESTKPKSRRKGPLEGITLSEMQDTGALMKRHQYLVNIDKRGAWKLSDTDPSRLAFLTAALSAIDKAGADGGDPVKLFVSSITECRRFGKCDHEDMARELFRDWQRQKQGSVMELAGVADSMMFEMPHDQDDEA